MVEKKIVYEGDSKRIDLFLKSIFPYSREFIKRLILGGNVYVNLKRVKPSFILSRGDVVEIKMKLQDEHTIDLKDITIYEDNDILVINKPHGLLVHPVDENWLVDYSTLEFSKNTLAGILYFQKFNNSALDLKRLGIVHRLDAETSGVMVVAKNRKAQEDLIEQFSKRKVYKKYKAVCSGIIEKDSITIEAPIGRYCGFRKIEVMEYGRDAITIIEVVKRGKENTSLNAFPKTGRTNQIRVHLAFIKHPVIGDRIYSRTDYERLMLHSLEIGFIHPSKLKEVRFVANPDDDFIKRYNELMK